MNKIRARCISCLLAVSPFFVSLSLCQEISKTMTKVSTRIIKPEPDPASFAAQPKPGGPPFRAFCKGGDVPAVRSPLV